MHYQAFRRLGELHDVIVVVVRDDERKPVKDCNLVTGNTRAKAKATEMINLIKSPVFWDALAVYVTIKIFIIIDHLIFTRLEQHLEPLAVTANTLQATHCRLDTVLLAFGYLIKRYRAMVAPEDLIGCTAILNSLEKRWLAADQRIFIATVIVNPFYRTTAFAPRQRFINAHIKNLLASLYLRFFGTPVPDEFYTELHDFLMGSGQYNELEVTCARYIHRSKDEVCFPYCHSKTASVNAQESTKNLDPLAVLQDFLIPARPPTPFYRLANRLLSICTNSATCERLFSTFGTTLTKLRNRMNTSTLTALAELKMHIRSEHQEKLTKLRMKHLFDRRSRNSFLDPTPTSTPPDPEPIVTHSTSPPSETSMSGLSHLIPNDVEDDEADPTGTDDPIPLHELFDFENDCWVRLYDGQGKKRMAEELAVCELLSQDAMTDEGVEVDVDDMTSDILMT